jgi:hypothetical protein
MQLRSVRKYSADPAAVNWRIDRSRIILLSAKRSSHT